MPTFRYEEKYKAGDIIQILKTTGMVNHVDHTEDDFLVLQLLQPASCYRGADVYVQGICLTAHILGVGYDLSLSTDWKYLRKLPKYAFAHLLSD